MTLTGNFGLRYNITEGATTTPTGEITTVYSINTTVGDMTIGTSDITFNYYGYVGKNAYILDLKSINNISGASTGIDMKVVRNNAGALTNVKYIAIYNASTTNHLKITPNASTSILTGSEQITILPNCGMALAYGTPLTVGATSSVMSIVASGGSTYHTIYILGN